MNSKPTNLERELNLAQDVTEKSIHVTVIDREDQIHQIEAPTDMSLNLMELIKAYELPIQATCGGMALCSTCHVFIESEHKLTERSEAEELALEQSFDMDEDRSRLSCQIPVTEKLDGLVVRLAPES